MFVCAYKCPCVRACVRACVCLFVYVRLCDWEGGGVGDNENDYLVRHNYGGEQQLMLVCVAGCPHPATHTFHVSRRSMPAPNCQPLLLPSLPPRRHDPTHLAPFRTQTYMSSTHLQHRCVCVPRSPLRHAPRTTHLMSSAVRPMLRSSDGASAVAASALSWF